MRLGVPDTRKAAANSRPLVFWACPRAAQNLTKPWFPLFACVNLAVWSASRTAGGLSTGSVWTEGLVLRNHRGAKSAEKGVVEVSLRGLESAKQSLVVLVN